MPILRRWIIVLRIEISTTRPEEAKGHEKLAFFVKEKNICNHLRKKTHSIQNMPTIMVTLLSSTSQVDWEIITSPADGTESIMQLG